MTVRRRVVIAPDSFKGSISAHHAAEALARGWRRESPGDEVVLRPLADGGEGTLEAFLAAIPGARRRHVRVTGADGARHDSVWVLLPPDPRGGGATGVVEVASTSGIEALAGRLRPWDAGTEGLGQAMAAALADGVTRLVVGLGSSASTDGGAGMLRALGAQLTDAEGSPIRPGLRGLRDLVRVDLSGMARPPAGGVVALADVDNPLCGPRGAAAAFGPQKGLPASEVAEADAILARWAGHLAGPHDMPGGGAAGGTGFALRAWGAQLVSGAAYVAELAGLRDLLHPDTVVITGEGSYDVGSASGKLPCVVARIVRDAGARAALVAGRIEQGADLSAFATTLSLTDIAGEGASARAEPQRHLETAGALLSRRL